MARNLKSCGLLAAVKERRPEVAKTGTDLVVLPLVDDYFRNYLRQKLLVCGRGHRKSSLLYSSCVKTR